MCNKSKTQREVGVKRREPLCFLSLHLQPQKTKGFLGGYGGLTGNARTANLCALSGKRIAYFPFRLFHYEIPMNMMPCTTLNGNHLLKLVIVFFLFSVLLVALMMGNLFIQLTMAISYIGHNLRPHCATLLIHGQATGNTLLTFECAEPGVMRRSLRAWVWGGYFY